MNETEMIAEAEQVEAVSAALPEGMLANPTRVRI